MNKKTVRPLFTWAGGKSRLINSFYRSLLPPDACRRPYVEPFAGGAALFLHLSMQEQLDAILADVNAELMDLYRLVRDDPDYLIAAMAAYETCWMPLDIAERKALYYKLRERYWSLGDGPEATSLLYFLMKTGFNGIWQTCHASRGRYATPVGPARQRTHLFSPDIIRTWSGYLSHTELRTASYEEIDIPEGAFVFCDPPYRKSYTSYGTEFDDKAQIALIEWARRIHLTRNATVWLSNRDCGDRFFRSHAPEARFECSPITYTAGRVAAHAMEILLIWDCDRNRGGKNPGHRDLAVPAD